MPVTHPTFTPQHPPTPRDVRALIGDIDAWLRGDDHTDEWDPEPLLTRAAAMLAILRIPDPAR
ncbi:MAG: hypothetical protein IPN47_00770 [Gemmatimonadetes bacterium]|nr:hypothetical protein [Gemmatimonadota bacterium]